MREHQLVSDMLQEMTDVLGCANRSCNPHDHRWHLGCLLPRVPAMIVRAGITDTNIRWEDDFLLSGSKVGVGNETRVWRFTPRDPTSFQPMIANPRGAAGNVSIP